MERRDKKYLLIAIAAVVGFLLLVYVSTPKPVEAVGVQHFSNQYLSFDYPDSLEYNNFQPTIATVDNTTFCCIRLFNEGDSELTVQLTSFNPQNANMTAYGDYTGSLTVDGYPARTHISDGIYSMIVEVSPTIIYRVDCQGYDAENAFETVKNSVVIKKNESDWNDYFQNAPATVMINKPAILHITKTFIASSGFNGIYSFSFVNIIARHSTNNNPNPINGLLIVMMQNTMKATINHVILLI